MAFRRSTVRSRSAPPLKTNDLRRRSNVGFFILYAVLYATRPAAVQSATLRLGDKRGLPNPEPPSPARVSAAVARLSRRHARACDHLASVFGEGSAAVVALARRVDALYTAGRFDQPERASRLRDLAMWLDAAAE